MFRDPRLSRMAAFLESIGIEMRAGTIDVATLFPGSLVSRGSLVVDESMLVAPGDALHEAAHIALAPPGRRSADFGFIEAATGGEELTTISWSWGGAAGARPTAGRYLPRHRVQARRLPNDHRLRTPRDLHRLPLTADVGDGVRRAECTVTRREAFPSHGEVGPRVTLPLPTHVSIEEISDIKLSLTGKLSFLAQSDNHDFNIGLRRKKRLRDALWEGRFGKT
jgi:hypothetical protein